MALLPEDVKKLTAPFAFEDHEFNRGFVYISEQAVCARIETVDPSWYWDLKSVQIRDNAAVVVGTLTIAGVTREGVGMDKVLENAGEAEKSAATDALKRAARLFGVGRYILDHPKETDFKAWLAKMAKGDSPAAPTPAPEEPTVNGWTMAQAGSLTTEARNNGITDDELLQMLRVSRISEYEPGFSAARDNLRKFIAAKRQTANAEPAVL
jgi:hypothetical protein